MTICMVLGLLERYALAAVVRAVCVEVGRKWARVCRSLKHGGVALVITGGGEENNILAVYCGIITIIRYAGYPLNASTPSF